jgi:sucrose-6-phosphate hydrolase SacC (GH32 family)
MMLLPTELTLKTTKEGIRMFNVPVKEVDAMQEKEYAWENLDGEKASEMLKQFNNAGSLRIMATIKLSHSTDAGLNLFGQTIFKYDLNFNQINGLFYTPEDRTSMEISVDLILDKTSIEAFVYGGAFSYAIERKANPGNNEGFRFFGNRIEVKSLKVYPLKSIWSK